MKNLPSAISAKILRRQILHFRVTVCPFSHYSLSGTAAYAFLPVGHMPWM